MAIDAAGAAMTSAITLGLLASGIVESGVALPVWGVLGSVAFAMFVAGAFALRRNASPASVLGRLSKANAAYALASVATVAVFRETVTPIVIAYVAIESVVLIILAVVESRCASR